MRIKKVLALMLALVLVLGMSSVAFAAETTALDENGEAGAFAPDESPEHQEKKLVLLKEIVAYNPATTTIAAPTISYSYAIDVAEVPDSASVTDKAGVKAYVSGGIAGASITGTIAWSCADEDDNMQASPDGESNTKEIVIDFSTVNFGNAGIYRYVITETISDDAYVAAGVTKTPAIDPAVENYDQHVRYVDVYVRHVTDNPDATGADAWEIYGYTCFCINAVDIIDEHTEGDETIGSNKNTVAVIKTTGFVGREATRATVALPSDSYYTYNVEISKTVTGDSYSEENTAFPFTIYMDNGPTNAYRVIAQKSADPAPDGDLTLEEGVTKGIVKFKSGASVKYIGIPCGVDTSVYETNIEKGVTYEATTVLNGDTEHAIVNTNMTAAQAAPTTAVKQPLDKAAYESRMVTIDTDPDTAVTAEKTVAITNKVLTISPTGLIIRYAPYALALIGGLLLLFFGWKLFRRDEEEEKA